MKIKVGKIENDNIAFFLITIMSVVNSYLGFLGILFYLLFAFYTKNVRRMMLPVIYLSINTAIADYVLFQGVNYFQIISLITFLLCFMTGKKAMKRLSDTVAKNPWMFLMYIGLMILCFTRTGGIRIFLCLILLTLILVMVINSEKSFKDVCDAVLIAGNQIVFLGIVEFALQKTFFYSLWTKGERYRYGILRIGSTVSDPNYICLMLVPLLLLAFYMLKKYQDTRYRLCFWMYVTMCVLSMSRMGLLCMILAISFIIRRYYFSKMRKSSQYIVNAMLILTCATIFYGLFERFMGTSDSTLMASNFTRNVSIQYGLYLLTQNLWTGIGMGNFYEYAQPLFYKDYGGNFAEGLTVMNMPLEIGLAFGLLGLIIIGLINVDTCIKARRDKEFPGIYMLACFWVMALTLDGMTIGLFWILIILPRIHMDIDRKDRIIRRLTVPSGEVRRN